MSNSTMPAMGMLDVHTHILPAIDDGSANADESIRMIRASMAQGINALAMTPHFYPTRESLKRFLSRREQSIRTLIPAIEKQDCMLDIYFGAETEYFAGISNVEDIEKLCIGRSRVLLVEMPFAPWSRMMVHELLALRNSRGLTPLIAHIERYIDYQSADIINELMEGGMLIQSNASFFLRRATARRAMRMLKKRQIHLLGSDCHNTDSRPPNLGLALEKFDDDDIGYLRSMQRHVLGEGC